MASKFLFSIQKLKMELFNWLVELNLLHRWSFTLFCLPCSHLVIEDIHETKGLFVFSSLSNPNNGCTVWGVACRKPELLSIDCDENKKE